MRVCIVANKDQQEEIAGKGFKAYVKLFFTENLPSGQLLKDYDCLFWLHESFDEDYKKDLNRIPVFINDVVNTLEQQEMPSNFHRINGWKGFLKRDIWEIASNDKSSVPTIFDAIGWKYIFVKDEPGLVAARVISMIINEAYFALDEEVSTAVEIDMAMKLGTNYPYGPFEWLNIIGLEKIYNLLEQLSLTDNRYSIAPLLKKKYINNLQID